MQGYSTRKKQFRTTLEGPKHREIKSIIPGGIEEQGVVKFEALDYNEEKARLFKLPSCRKAKDKSAIDSSLMFPSLRLILIREIHICSELESLFN